MKDGVHERLDDARVLWANRRKIGALLMALIAVAGTSRKRYPQSHIKSDKKAFTKFIKDEMASGSFFGGNRSLGTFNINFRGKMCEFQDILYEVIRCELVHEADMPEDILFEPGAGFQVTVDEKKITFSDGLLDCLGRIVEKAPENAVPCDEASK